MHLNKPNKLIDRYVKSIFKRAPQASLVQNKACSKVKIMQSPKLKKLKWHKGIKIPKFELLYNTGEFFHENAHFH